MPKRFTPVSFSACVIYYANNLPRRGFTIQRTDDPSPLISFPAINLQRYRCAATLNLNLPFIEATRRAAAGTPPVHRVLRPPPRQFPRTANFMHLLTRERDSNPVREEAPLSRTMSLYRGGIHIYICMYTELPRRVTRFEEKERKEETNETRNEEPEVSPAALRPLDPLADGSSLDRTEVPWLYCRLSLGLIVTSFA